MDKYQKRYLKHQERKKKILSGEIEKGNIIEHNPFEFMQLVQSRTSQRIFNRDRISNNELDYIKEAIINTPSSCNRQAIKIKIVRHSIDKAVLEDFLVGGANWIGNANVVILLYADMKAYKSVSEVDFMPFLDAGFIGMSTYYAAEAIGLGCCFVNPNIREENKEDFNGIFNKENHKFCGAIALGHYDNKSIKVKKSNNIEV